jgi:MFS transporter, YNFM family, putative membrane transport protein
VAGSPPALVSGVYLVYAVGVVVSPLAGRLSSRIAPRRLITLGLLVEGLGMAATLVNATARSAKGGASALYLTFYAVGGTLGSLLPGLAWQAAGWPGVVASCAAALALGLLANGLLCGRPAREAAPER